MSSLIALSVILAIPVQEENQVLGLYVPPHDEPPAAAFAEWKAGNEEGLKTEKGCYKAICNTPAMFVDRSRTEDFLNCTSGSATSNSCGGVKSDLWASDGPGATCYKKFMEKEVKDAKWPGVNFECEDYMAPQYLAKFYADCPAPPSPPPAPCAWWCADHKKDWNVCQRLHRTRCRRSTTPKLC